LPPLDDRIAEIYAAPRGRRIAALFDYDGTVIEGYSAEAFFRQRLRSLDVGPIELARILLAAVKGLETEEDFAEFLDVTLAALKGHTMDEMVELGEKLFKYQIAGKLYPEVWRIVEAHHAMGHTVVLASSATHFQVDPMAREVGAHHVVCTELEVEEGVLTGRTQGTPRWGGGKARGVQELARMQRLDLARSFAYANGNEDVPFLESVGNPVAVNPGSVLRKTASHRGWPVLDCRSRGSGPMELARTAAFYGGLVTAFSVGAGIGLLNRSRQQMLDIGSGVGSDLALALAGVDVKVLEGAEHLWSSRPCVFVFNHQSKLDPIVVMNLVRGGFTGVAKKEVRSVPFFGQVFMLAGVAFVDRGNIKQAKQALEPAVRKIRDDGLSLVISPEGTRTPTPRLTRFKKGPFHIAMQAEVPMVPIVIRNAGEIMWRGAQTLHQGTVEVVVKPPVATSGWERETINEHVEGVRNIFVETLENWPGDQQRPRRRAGTRAGEGSNGRRTLTTKATP
jgi:putative phosphoserine phosphatase / 1-acylglycerol-3-phosphate O-acyltransferase